MATAPVLRSPIGARLFCLALALLCRLPFAGIARLTSHVEEDPDVRTEASGRRIPRGRLADVADSGDHDYLLGHHDRADHLSEEGGHRQREAARPPQEP